MGELCPGAVQKPAAVLLPLDLFPCPRPSSLEPIALSHPNFQTTKTCRGRVVGCAPGAVLGPGAVPQPEISWSFESTSEPQPIALPSTTLPRKARAGGGAVLPPRVTWSRPPHPPDGSRGSSIYPSSPRPPAQAGNSGPTAEPPARELVPALSRTPLPRGRRRAHHVGGRRDPAGHGP